MTLTPGTKLGPYEILTPLGVGGMGEVWKAKDTRLDRFVAVKVLPSEMATNADALARFEREAKAVAALNHPNITGIFDIGRVDDIAYAVMELLEGESLRTRLMEGPLTPRLAAELAVQMAHGLAAAHDKGVIHRDLKPDNLWITSEGRLKILDFGLAKQVAPMGRGSQSYLATQAVSPGHVLHTEEGMILGTMGYMSPEQVRGETVDARSDIFSFGVVLFEMLTGQKAFTRDTAADTMAAILKEDPPELLDSGKAMPMGLRRIVDHCLEKIPARRFHDAQDLAFALESAAAPSSNSNAPFTAPFAPQNRRTSWRWAALGAILLAVAVLAGWTLRGKLAPSQANSPVAVRFLTYSGRDTSPAVSPDGRTIAFSSQRDGQPRIWLKQLRGGGELALTTGPDDFPRFSPDGSSILFIRSEGSGTSLYRMSVLGTDVHKVAEGATHGDWSPDGNRIAFLRAKAEAGTVQSILLFIDAGGGAEKELARFPSERMVAPRWSPDGSAIALTSDGNSSGGYIPKIIRVGARDGAIRAFGTATKFGAISTSVWVSSEEVVYFQAESVIGNGAGTSPSKAYRQNLSTGSVQPLFWAPVSATGVDVLPGGRVVFDGISGRQALREYPLDRKGPPRWLTRGNINDRQPVFSHEGEWVVFSSNRSGNLDLWEVSSRTGVVKSLTDDAAEDWDPGFTPDGKHILWSSNRSGAFEIWMANPDGSGAHQVSQDGVDAENPTMTRDGRWVVYMSTNPKAPGMWKVHPDGTGAERVVGGTNMNLPEVSPDGQYVMYQSQLNPLLVTLHVVRVEDGSKEVFQTTVEGLRKTVATSGRSRWMPDGRHIIFTGQDEKGLDGVFIQDFLPGKDTRATRRPIAGFDPDWITESLGLSPDGTRLVLSETERMFSLLVAEGGTGLPTQRKGPK